MRYFNYNLTEDIPTAAYITSSDSLRIEQSLARFSLSPLITLRHVRIYDA